VRISLTISSSASTLCNLRAVITLLAGASGDNSASFSSAAGGGGEDDDDADRV